MFLCFVTESRPTFGDPLDYSPPGSSVHGVLQARILEQVAMSYCRGSGNPGIELTSPVSPALRWILYLLSHCGSPMEYPAKILKLHEV